MSPALCRQPLPVEEARELTARLIPESPRYPPSALLLGYMAASALFFRCFSAEDREMGCVPPCAGWLWGCV